MNIKNSVALLDSVSRWQTFDELYSKVQCDCDWTDFVLQLERLVDRGHVEYALSPGMDVGCYRIKE